MVSASAREESQKVREWLLAILRFAVTLEQTDRSAVMAIAKAMDTPKPDHALSRFTFFVRTSVEFCDGILASDTPEKAARLRRYFRNIDDARLRRAFGAVLKVERATTKSLKSSSRSRRDLFRGLPTYPTRVNKPRSGSSIPRE